MVFIIAATIKATFISIGVQSLFSV